MTRTLLLVALATVPVMAAPTTQPAPARPEAKPLSRATLVDTRQPAFAPKFVHTDTTPAGHFAEREYANRFTYPGPVFYGYGYYGYYGYGAGTWGSTQVLFR